MLTAAVIVAVLLGVAAIVAVYRRHRAWIAQTLRQIRELPEHAGERARR